MSSTTPPTRPTAAETVPSECLPDYDLFVTDGGKPVDGIYTEKQMRLLTSMLYTSWPGPGEGRPFLTHANVGVFFSIKEPPVVPDVLLSLDVWIGNPHIKKYQAYFVWVYGKMPEVVFEIVSNKEGEELGSKRQLYAKIGIPYYIVWDPEYHLSDQRLSCFVLHGRKYQSGEPWLPDVGLGVTEWKGAFEDWDNLWLRWCDEKGQVLPTAAEKSDQEKARAEQEKNRAEQEKARAEKLAAQLRALGVEPD